MSGLPTIFPFYTTTAERDRNKRDPVYSPTANFPPFQLVRAHLGANAVTSAVLVDPDSNETNIISYFSPLPTVYQLTSYDYIQYTGYALGSTLPSGAYSLKIGDGANTWYSEWMQIGSVTGLIKLTFTSSVEIGTAGYAPYYEQSFSQYAYMKGWIRHGSHENELMVSGFDGQDVIEEAITKQRYILRTYCTEAIHRALITLPAHDTVTILDTYGNTITAKNIEVSQPVWTPKIGRIDISFTDVNEILVYRINNGDWS